MMTKLTREEYVKEGGAKCPACGSNQLEGSFNFIGGGSMYQRIVCVECQAQWEDEYKLIGYVGLEEDEKEGQP